jgi:peptidoglycan/LPS O-acetylase OafA/YrhL
MLRVIGRTLIFVFSLALLVLGISEMVYLFAQYINEFDGIHIGLSVIQIVFSIAAGIYGLISITRGKKTEWLSISCVVLLGLAAYYYALLPTTPHHSYYLGLAILNTVMSVFILVSVFWNRKRI